MNDENEIEVLKKEVSNLENESESCKKENKLKKQKIFQEKINIIKDMIFKTVVDNNIKWGRSDTLDIPIKHITIKFYWNGISIDKNNKPIETFEIIIKNFKSIDLDCSYRATVSKGQNNPNKIEIKNKKSELESKIAYLKSEIENCKNFNASLCLENLKLKKCSINQKDNEEFDDGEFVNHLKEILFGTDIL